MRRKPQLTAGGEAHQAMEERGDKAGKIYKFIIPSKYMGLTIPASMLTREVLQYIYEISGGHFTVEELVFGEAGSEKSGRGNSAGSGGAA